jgi:hypothetical protein
LFVAIIIIEARLLRLIPNGGSVSVNMKNVKFNIRFWLMGIFSLISMAAFSQGDPTDSLPGDPGALEVYLIQDLNFGAFSKNNGGTITVSNTGARSATGDVVPLNLGFNYFEAIYEVEAPPNSVVSILNGPNVTLVGSNGGTLSLSIGTSNPGSPFMTTVSPPARTTVRIGGTLTAGNNTAAPPGTYIGTFEVTFNLE